MNKKIIAFASLFFIWQSDALAISNTPLSSFIKIALEDNLGLKSERLSLSQGEINLNKAKKVSFARRSGLLV